MMKATDYGKATVIVVNWNGQRFLDECLTALGRQSYPNFGVILVDNGSTDGSVEFVRERFPLVDIISLPENIGFAGANNRAINRALADGTQYVALLNNDTKADEQWLEHLVRVMASGRDIGICAPRCCGWTPPHPRLGGAHVQMGENLRAGSR